MAEEEKKEARYRLLTLRVAVGLTMAAGADANVKRIIRQAGKMKFAARGWIAPNMPGGSAMSTPPTSTW